MLVTRLSCLLVFAEFVVTSQNVFYYIFFVLFSYAGMPMEPSFNENAVPLEPVKFQLKVVDPDKVVQRVISLNKHVPVSRN